MGADVENKGFSAKKLQSVINFMHSKLKLSLAIQVNIKPRIPLIIVNEYDQEIPQSQTADKPMAPR